MMWDSFFSAALHATGERPSVYTCVMLHTHSLVNLLKPCRLTRPTLFVNCLFPILLFGAAACELQVRSVLHSVSTHLHKRARCSLQCRNDTSPQKQRQLRETKGLYRNILRNLQRGTWPYSNLDVYWFPVSEQASGLPRKFHSKSASLHVKRI